jgi:hypothetical protein
VRTQQTNIKKNFHKFFCFFLNFRFASNYLYQIEYIAGMIINIELKKYPQTATLKIILDNENSNLVEI